MKTLICIPCFDQVPAQFAQSLATLNKVGDCAVAFEIGSLIYNARNDLAMKAIQGGYDHVLWFDSDMTFTPDTFQRLYATMEKTGADIVSGLYFRRVPPYTPVIFTKLDFEDDGCVFENPEDYPDEPFEVEGVGFGCVLQKTETLLSVALKHKNLFAPIHGVGEDLSFSWRARDCGYRIFVDPSIKLGHVGHYTVTEEMYKVYRSSKNDTK